MMTIREYARPATLEEAWQLNQKKPNRVLGGMLWLKMEKINVGTAIDLSALGLDTIEETDTEIIIGAIILGFNTKDEIFYAEEFEKLGAEVHIATADGSVGTKGFVTDVVKTIPDYTYFYTCGPEPMLKALSAATKTSGQLSFEERMGCGFGACMGCSCKTKYGNKRICKDGPVLVKEEIIW